jgi:uncharacterized protein (DUF1330 family)
MVMKAYIIVDVDIHDPEKYDRYKALTPASLIPFGGKFVVRGAKTTTLEGDWKPGRFVMLEFPSADAAHAWWSSPGYADARKLRQSASTTQMILVEGPPFDPAAAP